MTDLFQPYWSTPLPKEYLKENPQRLLLKQKYEKDRVSNIEELSPDVYQAMCSSINKYFPGRDCGKILQIVFDVNLPHMDNVYIEGNFMMALERAFYEILASSLRNKGFTEAFRENNKIILYNRRQAIQNICTFIGILTYLLSNFDYKDYFHIENELGFMKLSVKTSIDADTQRGIVLELIKYLYRTVMNNPILRGAYDENQRTLLRYHYIEQFDHPSVLVTSALLSTITRQYGFVTYQSNSDWSNTKNIDFWITFQSLNNIGPEYFNRIRFEREDKEFVWRQQIFTILSDTNRIKSGFDSKGEYIVARYEIIHNIKEVSGLNQILLELVNLINQLE